MCDELPRVGAFSTSTSHAACPWDWSRADRCNRDWWIHRRGRLPRRRIECEQRPRWPTSRHRRLRNRLCVAVDRVAPGTSWAVTGPVTRGYSRCAWSKPHLAVPPWRANPSPKRRAPRRCRHRGSNRLNRHAASRRHVVSCCARSDRWPGCILQFARRVWLDLCCHHGGRSHCGMALARQSGQSTIRHRHARCPCARNVSVGMAARSRAGLADGSVGRYRRIVVRCCSCDHRCGGSPDRRVRSRWLRDLRGCCSRCMGRRGS